MRFFFVFFLNILLPHIVFSWLPSVQTKKKRKDRLAVLGVLNDGISSFEVTKKKKKKNIFSGEHEQQAEQSDAGFQTVLRESRARDV